MQRATPNLDESRPFSWRHGLYARALAVMGIGSALLLSGVAGLSTLVVEGFVDQLLADRYDLVAATAGHLQDEIDLDLARLSAALATSPATPAALQAQLDRTALGTYFEGRAFVADAEGRVVAHTAAVNPETIEETLRTQGLVAEVQSKHRSAVSRITASGAEDLVFLAPKTDSRAPHLYAGGVVAPRAVSLLRMVGIEKSSAVYQLIDAGGTIVATTAPTGLLQTADHGALLTRAVRDRQPVRSRCHSCHTGPEAVDEPVTDILAFAPLPALALGVALRQLETEALAPASVMRRRLIWSAVLFVGAFLVFAWLAVRSVVHPLSRLIRALRRLRATDAREQLPKFGNNEVGALAQVLSAWRARVADAVVEIEAHRNALRVEVESSHRLLETLDRVTELSLKADDVPAIVRHGLTKIMEIQGFPAGTLSLRYGDRDFEAQIGMSPEAATALRAAAQAGFGTAPSSPVGDDQHRCRTCLLDPAVAHPAAAELDGQILLAADLAVPGGLTLSCVLAQAKGPPQLEEERLHSLLHHVLIGAANRLLQDEQQHRHQLRQELLGKILTAQEEERRRLARELHDTVSQDLAAIRLELERLGNQPEGTACGPRLRAVEEQIQVLLSTVRRITLDLRPLVLDRLGFMPALQWHLERLEREHATRGQLVVDGEVRDLDRNVSLSLFRIFQESLNNVVQHASAPHVFVTLRFRDNRVTMIVEDDGRGFDRARLRGATIGGDPRGLGLLGIEERAHLLGGELVVESAPDEGTTVSVTLPLQPAATRSSVP
ncbi:MAG: sensor histidine kinase [Deltaproteobacteria bacterium]|nr:sensor histidine kinase [Deltaproteobacteria bacterium]